MLRSSPILFRRVTDKVNALNYHHLYTEMNKMPFLDPSHQAANSWMRPDFATQSGISSENVSIDMRILYALSSMEQPTVVRTDNVANQLRTVASDQSECV